MMIIQYNILEFIIIHLNNIIIKKIKIFILKYIKTKLKMKYFIINKMIKDCLIILFLIIKIINMKILIKMMWKNNNDNDNHLHCLPNEDY